MTTSLPAKASTSPRVVVLNGPEDGPLDWLSIDWQGVEEDVRRLRQRIFTASQAGDLKKVRNLQKLMLRSRSNTLMSVRRVTEQNAGRKTAGIDGEWCCSPERRLNWPTGCSADPNRGWPVRSGGCLSRRQVASSAHLEFR